MKNIQAPISLRQFSSIQISKCIWKQPDINTVLEYHVMNGLAWRLYGGPTRFYTTSENTLPTLVLSKISALNLPKIVEKDLQFVVGEMGAVLVLWLNQVNRMLQRDQKADVNLKYYIKHICWTDHGLIDSSKTLRSLYLSKSIPPGNVILTQLCYYCAEDCIRNCWPNVPKLKAFSCSSHETILMHYWRCCIENRMDRFVKDCRGVFHFDDYYNSSYSIEENMLLMSFADHNYSAVKYFWKLLDDEQRRKIIEDIFQMLTENHEGNRPYINLLGTGQELHVDVFIFYVQQLFNYDLQNLWITMLQSKNVLIFSLMWPYQDLFTTMLEQSTEYNSKVCYDSVLYEILNGIRKQNTIIGHDNRYHDIFYELWQSGLPDLKDAIYHSSVIDNLAMMKDIEFINFLINNEEFKDYRSILLDSAMQFFICEQLDTEFYEEFIEKILVSDDERIWFRDVVSACSESQMIGMECRAKRSRRNWWYKVFCRPFRSVWFLRRFK